MGGLFVIQTERGESMWEELYERHYKELKRYATGICRDPELAEDLTQETFVKALQSGDVFGDLGPSQRRAWLYRALKNLICDRYRRAKLESDYLDTLQAETAYWEPGIQAAENQLLLATLTPEDRALFHLRYEEGYNASELAEMFHVPPGTIRARLSRTRSLLKKKLFDE